MDFILSHCKVSLESTSGTECHKGDGFLQGIGIYHVQIPDHEHEHFDTIRLLTNCGTWCSTCKAILFGCLWNETRCKQNIVHLLSGGKRLAYFGIRTEPLLVINQYQWHQDDRGFPEQNLHFPWFCIPIYTGFVLGFCSLWTKRLVFSVPVNLTRQCKNKHLKMLNPLKNDDFPLSC